MSAIKKVYLKLMAITLALILSATVVVASSYAWFVLSDSPVVNSIQVTIGGGNTILIAADTVEVVDGVTYHYPSYFSDTLNFAQHDTYGYLSTLGGLSPVSTADGINWFIPDYYDATDYVVQQGMVPSGTLKEFEYFHRDYMLEFANLENTREEEISTGSYVYLDFWVVSPGSNYQLRLSTGKDSAGTFLIGLMEPDETADGCYRLAQAGDQTAACARVGFLANEQQVTTNAMERYMRSTFYSEQYAVLKGVLTEPGEAGYATEVNRFTIYEPNADVHPQKADLNGKYAVTTPIGWTGNSYTLADVSDRLTAQLRSTWANAITGSGTQIEQMFQTAIAGQGFRSQTVAELRREFYSDYLQGQVSPYVDKGWFIKNTGSLYTAQVNGTVSAEYLSMENVTAGATEDVYIVELERNVPQRIRMFIWLEGQDVDCVNTASAAGFALNIELAGSTVSNNE